MGSQPHGRAWKILNKERLINEVIPNYYVCKKYSSFTRQLNGWGFKRLHQTGRGKRKPCLRYIIHISDTLTHIIWNITIYPTFPNFSDFGCYYHESFLRDCPKITCLIRRLPGNQGKFTPFAEGEPNFYGINEEYPLTKPEEDTKEEEVETSKPLAVTLNSPFDMAVQPALPLSASRVSPLLTAEQRYAFDQLTMSNEAPQGGMMSYKVTSNSTQTGSFYDISQVPEPQTYCTSSSSGQYQLGTGYSHYPAPSDYYLPAYSNPQVQQYQPPAPTNMAPNEPLFPEYHRDTSTFDYIDSAEYPKTPPFSSCPAVSSSEAATCISHAEGGACFPAKQLHQPEGDLKENAYTPGEVGDDPFEPIPLS